MALLRRRLTRRCTGLLAICHPSCIRKKAARYWSQVSLTLGSSPEISRWTNHSNRIGCCWHPHPFCVTYYFAPVLGPRNRRVRGTRARIRRSGRVEEILSHCAATRLVFRVALFESGANCGRVRTSSGSSIPCSNFYRASVVRRRFHVRNGVTW